MMVDSLGKQQKGPELRLRPFLRLFWAAGGFNVGLIHAALLT